MDDMSFNIRVPKRWVRMGMVALVTAVIVAPLTAIAAHTFTDVPDSNTFHEDIAWLKDAGVTLGCNPPTNTEFCPKDEVTREQMSAFMRRLAENQVVDAATAVEAENATTADVASTVDDGAIGTDQIADDAAGVAVAGVSTFTTGTVVTNWFNRLGGQPTVTNTGTGQYDVVIPGLENQLGCDAIINVSVIGFGGFADIAACAGLDEIEITTYSPTGTLVNRSFNVVVMTPGQPGGLAAVNDAGSGEGQ